MAKKTYIVSHWSTMIEGLQISPKDFTKALEAHIHERNIPDVKHSRVDWREGGLLSAKREYLRLQRKELTFDIGAAPFGNGFFVSWWLGEAPSGLLSFLYKIPILSWFAYWFESLFKTETYYKHDTAQMYQSLIHSAVLATVDEFTKMKGLRAIGAEQRTPKTRDFFSE